MAASRRLIAALVRTGLVVLAIIVIAAWFTRHRPHHSRLRVMSAPPPAEALHPGDLRILSTDSSVDLILQGDSILAGLSQKTIAKVKGALDSSALHDSGSGLGASIGQLVRKSVAGAIGTHAVFPLSEIRDLHYADHQIVVDWVDGSKRGLFGSTKVNHNTVSSSFSPADAERFVAAVRARKGLPPGGAP